MGMGMVEESNSAAAPTPQMPNLAKKLAKKRAMSFHLAINKTKSFFKQGPFPPDHPS